MAVEVYRSTGHMIYGSFELALFELATFISASAHFNIIDSYSSITGRYKGDPIADGSWISAGSVGEANDWIIIQSVTTIHSGLSLPAWEAKFQFTNGPGLADVSDPTGVKYPKAHGRNRSNYVRFSPWGGWDLANSTPDFNPTVTPTPSPLPSSANHYFSLSHGGSGADVRWILICTDGQLAFISYKNQGAYEPMNIGLVMGDVLPVSSAHMSNPRAMLVASGNATLGGLGPNYWLSESTFTSGSADFSTGWPSGIGAVFFDNNNVLIQQGYRLNSDWVAMGLYGETQPNLHSASSLDMFAYIPMPTTKKGQWFSVPMLRKGYGVGYYPVDSGNWLSLSHVYGMYIRWDGTKSLY